MSSARKRSALTKAHNEIQQLRTQLALAQHHYNVMKTFSEGLAKEVQGWRERFPEHTYRHQDDCVALK